MRCGIVSSLCSRLSLSVSASSATSGSGSSGSSASCRRRGAELLAEAAVVVEQRVVFEDQVLAHDALERHRLLEQLTARSPGLRRLLHRLAPLRLQLVERQDQLAQRVDERQAHQEEAQQDEFEKGTGVVHEGGRYNLRQL